MKQFLKCAEKRHDSWFFFQIIITWIVTFRLVHHFLNRSVNVKDDPQFLTSASFPLFSELTKTPFRAGRRCSKQQSLSSVIIHHRSFHLESRRSWINEIKRKVKEIYSLQFLNFAVHVTNKLLSVNSAQFIIALFADD